jgi:SAM-dependent methyltransferase
MEQPDRVRARLVTIPRGVIMRSKRATQNYAAKGKYVGVTAERYDAKRRREPVWAWEDEQIRTLFSTAPPHSVILDVPSGTGRFLPILSSMGHQVLAIDVSLDMLHVAARAAVDLHFSQRNICADAAAIPLNAKSTDYVISNRFMQWLPSRLHVKQVIRELCRVARVSVIIQNRTPPQLLDARASLARIRGGLLDAAVPGRRLRARIRPYRESFLCAVARECGFELAERTTPCPWDATLRYLVFQRYRG